MISIRFDIFSIILLEKNEWSRAEWIDVCRGIGICIVVLGHCSPPLYKLIYSFHMPLFFILSGYLFKERKLSTQMYNMIKRYLAPYFILCFINLMLMTIRGGGSNFLTYLFGIMYSRGTTQWMPNCSPLWFLTCIFCSLFIYNLICKIKSGKVRIILIIFCALVSYSLYLLDVPKLPWNIDTALMSLVFLYCSTMLKKYDSHFMKISPMVIIVLGVIGAVAAYINPEAVNFDNNYYGNTLLMIVSAITLSLCLIYFVRRINPLPKLFSFYGKHTIFIMGFDYLSGSIATQFVHHFMLVFVMKMIILTIGVLLWTGLIKFIPNEKVRQVLRI